MTILLLLGFVGPCDNLIRDGRNFLHGELVQLRTGLRSTVVTSICGHFKTIRAHVGPPVKSGQRFIFLFINAHQRLRKSTRCFSPMYSDIN